MKLAVYLATAGMLRTRMRAMLIVCSLSLLAASCGKSSEPTVEENATTGSLTITADEELRPAMDSLVKGFMLENPKAKVSVVYTTSGEAIQDLLAQQSRIIVISRFMTPEARTLLAEHKLILPEYDMAQDAIAVVVNPKNHLGSLAMSDLGKIIRGEISNWSQLAHSLPVTGTKLDAGEIEFAESPRSSSSEFLLDSLFLKTGEVQKIAAHRFVSSDSILDYVKHHENAIGVVGASWAHAYSTGADSSLRVALITPADSSSQGVNQPILLHLGNIFQGLYPLTLRVNGYTFENPNTLPRGFLAYAMTAHGQTVFKNFNVLPRTQQIKLVPAR